MQIHNVSGVKMLKLEDLIKDFNLEIIKKGKDDAIVKSNDINRPGLELAGYYNYFSNERVQIIGKAEVNYLNDMECELKKRRVKKYLDLGVEFIIITRGLNYPFEFIEYAIENNIWLLRTDMTTTSFINKIIMYLSEKFSPETRVHGVLMDVYGVGILITGNSGIGKSETALELIKRGHRLVSDDAVDIKNVDGRLKGTSPSITSGLMEVRGIGIVNIASLYGISSILIKKTINLVVELVHFDETGDYDRLGDQYNYENILGVDIRKVVIPISPGRNIAIILETAAVNYRQSLISTETAVDIIQRRTMEINSINNI